MQKHETYTLRVGEAGAERLRLLNKTCNPFSVDLLDKLGDISGKHILDLGCGTGIMTVELAKRVGIHGTVTAVDVSTEQLAIAKKNVSQQALTNIEFLELSVSEVHKLSKQFDIIYCRFVLAHVHDAVNIINNLKQLLKPQGYLIQEEPTAYEAMFSCPESEAFNTYKKILLYQSQVFKTDFFIGKKLYDIHQQLNLHNIAVKMCQPVLIDIEEKQQLWLGVKELIPVLTEAGFTTQAEMEELIVKMQNFANDNRYFVAFFQYIQIIGQIR